MLFNAFIIFYAAINLNLYSIWMPTIHIATTPCKFLCYCNVVSKEHTTYALLAYSIIIVYILMHDHDS